MKELEAFNPGLARRPQVLVANKIDLLGRDKSRLMELKRMAARKKIPFFAVSALKNEGLKPLVRAMAAALARQEMEREGGTP
jgi:GTP-binding protein